LAKLSKIYQSKSCYFCLRRENGQWQNRFTQGLTQALGIKGTVTSPTYDLIREYQGKNNLKLIHIDTWRMSEEEEIEEIEFKRKVIARSVIALEWADRIVKTLRRFSEEAVIIG